MYYIVSKDPKMACAVVHFGTYHHPLGDNESKEENNNILGAVKAQAA